MPICIAGMHRAGTSMVARLLNICGVYLGDDQDIGLKSPDNPEGFWEHQRFVDLNDEILARFGGGWDMPPDLPAGWELRPEMMPLRAQAAEILRFFDGREPWGWKDPRNSLVLPFWRGLLPNLKVLICVRNPFDVVQSLHKRGAVSQVLGFKLWLIYYQRLLADLRPEDRIITHYDSYFFDSAAELRRVLGLLQLPITEDLVAQACASTSPELRHNQATIRDLVAADAPADLIQLYVDLCAEAGPVYQLASGGNQQGLALEPASLDREQADSMRVLRLQTQLTDKAQAVATLREAIERNRQDSERQSQEIAQRDRKIIQLHTALAQKDQALKPLQAHIAGLHEKLVTTERQRQQSVSELNAIKSSLAFRVIRKVVWPVSSRLRPARVRSGLKGVARRFKRQFFRSAPAQPLKSAQPLKWALKTDLTEPFVVGNGNILYLEGWCYHPEQPIRQLSILADGKPYPAVWHSFARPDVGHNAVPNALMSGFWLHLPFKPIERSHVARLGLRATLANGLVLETSIGNLQLQPGEMQPIMLRQHTQHTAGQPLVAICMTTYNSQPGAFATQIESIIQQSYTNWICIIQDDQSSEEAFTAISRIVARDDRFYLFRNDERLGFYHNFETCLRRVPSTAQFVALADHDDQWYPDKLAACIAAFNNTTWLVYSDMDIVSEDGKLLSHTYWTGRRNNYTDLEVLLFANTVTGAACVFRTGMLPDILPFPTRTSDTFHDHWIASVALAKGDIGYIDRPLYAYRQHSNNVIGHYVVPTFRFLPPGTTILRVAFGVVFHRNLAARLEQWKQVYFAFLLPVVLIARIIRLRIKDAPPEKRAALDRFARLSESLPGLLTQAARYKIERRPTLGHEVYSLRGAIGIRLYNAYYRRKWRARNRRAKLNGALQAATQPALAKQVDISGQVEFIPNKIAPLQLRISEHHQPSVNILIPAINFRYLFAGYVGMFSLALQLDKQGYRVRIILVDKCDYDLPAWKKEIVQYKDIHDLFDRVEMIYAYDRSTVISVHPDDVFIATSWWTAYIAHKATKDLAKQKFVFFAQEYEPIFYPTSSLYALAEASYDLPHYAIFSTELLREYFCENRIGVFRSSTKQGECDSVAIENAVKGFDVIVPSLQRKRRKLLFYARPEQHAARNMFELGMLALQQAVQSGHFDPNLWEFHGMGAGNKYKNLQLAPGVELRLIPKVTLQEYHDLLPTYDVGLALMMTPHPSMVPIDMAAAGILAVTNTYKNKTAEKLRAISPNIIAVAPTLDSIAQGLITAVAQVDNFEQRVKASHIHWATSWDQSFNDAVMPQIHQFIENCKALR